MQEVAPGAPPARRHWARRPGVRTARLPVSVAERKTFLKTRRKLSPKLRLRNLKKPPAGGTGSCATAVTSAVVKCGPLEANRSQRRADWVDQSELASGHGWSVEIVVMALWSCDSVHCCGSYSTGSSPVAADPCESLADLCTGALPLTRSEVGCGCLCQSRGLVLPRARGWCERGSCGSMLASSQ
jgi:hypothetical protein